MIFQNPLYLLFLLLLPFMGLYIHKRIRDKQRLLNFFTGRVSFLTAHISYRARNVRRFLRISAFVFLILSAAAPQWGQIQTTMNRRGTDIILAVDSSRSMLCTDIRPSRFLSVRYKINYLLNKIQSDRTGLINFSGSAVVMAPLTVDPAAVNLLLDGISPGEISPPGTNLEAVLSTSREMFKNSGEGYKNLVIFTDGEDYSNGLSAELEKAASEGVRVFVLIASSQEGAPVPVLKNGKSDSYQKDSEGKLIMSKPDFSRMKELVEKTDGRFFLATSGNEDMDELAAEISQLEKRELKSMNRLRRQERYQWPAVFCLLLIVSEFLIRECKKCL